MVQGCWRAVGSSFGKSITFKTTVKGTNMLMKNGLGDLWMPCVCFLGLLASLGFGLHKVAMPACFQAAAPYRISLQAGCGVVLCCDCNLQWLVYQVVVLGNDSCMVQW